MQLPKQADVTDHHTENDLDPSPANTLHRHLPKKAAVPDNLTPPLSSFILH
jgi:hypothetical protein